MKIKKQKQKARTAKPSKSVSLKDQEQQVFDIGGQVEQPGPITVVNGRLLADYVKPVFSRDSNDDRFISLEFSVKLTEAHRTILPQKVLDAWGFVADEGGDGVKNIPIKPQTVRVYLTSDAKEEEVLIVGAVIENAKVDVVEERGSGEAVKFTRYMFRLQNERSKNLVHFGCWNDGKSVWLEMQPTQASLV